MDKQKNDRNKSRRKTPWDRLDELTPTQEFISTQYKEHYMQRHPKLEDTGEVELINSFAPSKCPYCGCERFQKYGHTRIGVQRFKCYNKDCNQTFLPTTGTIFDEHRISISEWIEYCMNIFRNVTVNADSWNNKNAFETSKYWLEKLFLLLEEYQRSIILTGKVWLDETYYSVMTRDRELNDDGSNPRGLSKNKICIGVGTDKRNTVIIAEGFGKPSQKMSYDAFITHIEPGSKLVHDKESTHKKLVAELSLESEEYSSNELKRLEDFENPLDPVNHIHYLIKRFLYAHSGFERGQIQSYLNLYAFVLNPPSDKLEKVEYLLNLAFQNPKLLRYRDMYAVNRAFGQK